jgi:hypothetical protein
LRDYSIEQRLAEFHGSPFVAMIADLAVLSLSI